jgi:hypothetical protein
MIRTSFVEKALVPGAPRSLGRALRKLRGAATPPAGFKPSDGDGDGRMSLAPGLPDETPVPPKPKDIVPEAVEAVSKKPTRYSFAQEYSYERMLKNLDLDAIDADLDKDLTLTELHELVGFPEPDANTRKFIIQGGADKKPKIKPTGKRQTGNRGRPAATYRTGDFIDLLKEAKQPKRLVKVKRFTKKEVTMEEINAALGDDAMDIGNLSKIVTRLGLKPIRTEQIPRGRPRRIFRSSDAYQVLTEYFDDYGYGTGPYGPRTQMARMGQTYQKSLSDQSTKILGLGIGKRRARGGKVRRRRFPQDGDGDGFYSPRPGMPDRTPVPAAAIQDAVTAVGEETLSASTATKREIEVFIQVAKDIEKSVLEKYGDFNTPAQARAVLKKAFPNASIRFFAGHPSEQPLTRNEKNLIIGLLHGATLKPKAAKRQTLIGNKPKEGAGGTHSWRVGPTGQIEFLGIQLDPKQDLRYAVILPKAANEPRAYTVARQAFEDGRYDINDLARAYAIELSLHEFGHAMHLDAAATDMGINDVDDRLPHELIAKNFAEATGQTLQEVNRAVDELLARPWTHPASWNGLDDNAKRNGIISHLVTQEPETQQEKIWSKLQRGIASEIGWDSVPAEKRSEILATFAKVSAYAARPSKDEWYHQSEGIAESFARREMSGGTVGESTRDAEKYMRWVLTKEAKMGKKIESNVDVPPFESCDGYITFEIDPKKAKKEFEAPVSATEKSLEQESKWWPEEADEKILGFGIGRRGPRRRRRSAPQDGDGDGFYSPRPGMPDRTPVPAAMAVDSMINLNLGQSKPAGMPLSVETTREIEAVRTRIKDIEKKVLRKYGPIDTHRQFADAHTKAFPNSRQGLFKGFDEELTDYERSFAIALLHAATVKPKAAKRIRKITTMDDYPKKDYPDLTDTAAAFITQIGGGRFLNPTLAFRVKGKDRFSEVHKGEKFIPARDLEPHIEAVCRAMHNSGKYTPEEIDQFEAYGIAMHEFGHAMHFDAAMSTVGVEKEDDFPPSKFAFDAYASIIQADPQEVKDAVEFSIKTQEKKIGNINYMFSGFDEDFWKTASYEEKVMVVILTGIRKMSKDDDEEKETLERFYSTYRNELGWDNVAEGDRAGVLAALAKASGYAKGPHETEKTAVAEGVAESFEIQHMTGASPVQRNSESDKFLRWVLTKEAKMKKDAIMKMFEPQTVNHCTGLYSVGKDGKRKPAIEKPLPDAPRKKVDLKKLFEEINK